MPRRPVIQGRYTAQIEGDFVVLLIGARINSLRGLRWARSLNTMNRMLKELSAAPEKGLLGFRMGFPTIVQYWRSFEHLEAWARDASDTHAKMWRDIYGAGFLQDGSAGIWHETYRVRAGEYEAVYGNMPAQGLAEISDPIPLRERGSARDRIAAAARGMSLRDLPPQRDPDRAAGADAGSRSEVGG
jgi:Monooxygenase af470-like